ncbi:Pentatricopeptide repeat [Dillenia turbinata]|uniref:Pentatricopeptide repeat n=1 Tax=Dillenia turbinata TaxID=194707 RepID=A0AAN8UM48_9MAGN
MAATTLGYVQKGLYEEGIELFCGMQRSNISPEQKCLIRTVSWNSMISAFAQNGEGEATPASFEEMVKSGLQPDSPAATGFHYFNSMTQIFRVNPRREHYASMVDLSCRRGQFDEAEKLMGQMPFHPDEIMIHRNHELAKRAADQLFNMELRDAAAYVNMSNIYAEAGHWDGVGKLKKATRERGVRKVPACIWVEIKHKIHIFSGNEKCHLQIKEIKGKIDMLMLKMEEGYKPDTSDVEEDIKVNL